MNTAPFLLYLLALLLATQSPPMERTRVQYPALPAGVEAASVLEWSDTGAPTVSERVVVRSGAALDLLHAPGRLVVVTFIRSDNAYVIDGPFVWPRREERRHVDLAWRKTIDGVAGDLTMIGLPLSFASAMQHTDTVWPACFWQSGTRWACFGVLLRTPVAVLWTRGSDGVWWSVVSDNAPAQWHRSDWARLLVMTGGTPLSEGPHVAVAHAVAAPARLKNVRLGVAAVPDAHVVSLDRAIVWIAAPRPPPVAWAEVRAQGSAPRYVSLEELASGPTTVPFPVLLEPGRTIEGRTSSSGEPVAGALVTLARLVDPAPQPGDRLKPRRVTIGEITTDDEGRFRFESLGDADYEVVAWHPRLGRASMFLGRAQSSVDLRFAPVGVARGRVLVGGKPASGAEVFSVPDMAAFAAADDPLDVKGGDTWTDRDGRFSVSVAAAGGGELRIGGAPYAVKRIPLPASPLPIVDVGDIELGGAIELTLVLDQEPGCSLRAAGPLGRAGLQVITAARSAPGVFQLSLPEEGAWQIDLDCPDARRAVLPSVVQVTRTMGRKEVRLMLQ